MIYFELGVNFLFIGSERYVNFLLSKIILRLGLLEDVLLQQLGARTKIYIFVSCLF